MTTHMELQETLERLGLQDAAEVYNSAIEVHQNVKRPEGGWWDGVTFLDAVVRHARNEGLEDALLLAAQYANSGKDNEQLSGLDCRMHVEALVEEIRGLKF